MKIENYKLKIIFLILLSIFYLPFSIPLARAVAGVPKILNHQGRLLDSSGSLLGGSGTDFCFKFSIYDDATVGAPDTKLWPSGAPSTMTINVKNGVFNAGIGDTSVGGDALDFNFQDNDAVFLNVEAASRVGATCAPGDGAEVFENLSPRQRVFSSGYTINSDTVDGFHAAQSASGNQIPVLSSGNLILGGVNPQLNATGSNILTLQGGGVTGDIQFFGSSNKITSSGALTIAGTFITTSGSVGIGTTSPSRLLSVHGDALFSGNLSLANLTATGTLTVSGSASSTFSNGINLSTGCFAVNGICVRGGGGGSGTINAGTQGQFPYYASDGTTLTATSTIFLSSGGNIGIGTTTPNYKLTVDGRTNLDNKLFTIKGGWAFFNIDSTGDVGENSSLFGADSNTLFVSYYDATANKDLKFAKSVNGGASWTASTVDSTGDVGQYTSLYSTASTTIFIGYYDFTNKDLKFAKSTDGGTSWTASTVDSTGDVGQYASIYATNSNTLFISYYDVTNSNLKFATSTNGGTSWTASTVDSSADVGQYSSLYATDSNTIFIAYYDAAPNNNLQFAKSTNGGNSWTTSAVDSTGDVGKYASLRATDSNTIFISYYDTTNNNLKFAKSANGGTSWTTSTIDSPGDVGAYSSLYATDSNTIFIAYYDGTPNKDLKFAKSADGGANWATSTISSVDDVGTSASLFASGDMQFIAYYDDTSNKNLKLAKFDTDQINVGIGVTDTLGYTLKVDGTVRASGGFFTGDEIYMGNLSTTTDYIKGSINLDLLGTPGHKLKIRDWDEMTLQTNLLQDKPSNSKVIGGQSLALPGGGVMQVYVSGQYGYLIFGSAAGTDILRILDVSQPSNPTVVGGASLSLPGSPRSIYVSGRYAYIIFRNIAGVDNFRVVDISNPSSPSVVGGNNLSLPANGQHVYVSGRYAYATFDNGAGADTFRIIDISNPKNPIVVGGASLSLPTSPRQIYVSGKYAYVVFYNTVNTDALRIIDISDPENPSVVGGSALALGFSTWSIHVSGRYAYIGFDNGAGAENFRVVDISNPVSPSVVEGSTISLQGFVKSLFVSGRYAYVTFDQPAGFNGFRIIDVFNPSSPEVAGAVDLPLPAFPKSVFVNGHYAYVGFFQGAGTDTFRIIDISGIEAVSVLAHSLEAGDLQVRNDITAQGQLKVGGGLNVGNGGIYTSGAITAGGGLTSGTVFQIGGSSTSTLFSIARGTSGALDFARVAVGGAPKEDQLYVYGRINSSWRAYQKEWMATCAPLADITADTADVCGLVFDEDTDGAVITRVSGSSAIRLRASGTLAVGEGAILGSGGTLPMSNNNNPVMEARILPITLTNHRLEVGFTNRALNGDIATDPTNGVYFRADPASPNWIAVNRAAGSETGSTVDTGIAVSTANFQELRVEINGSVNTRFFIDGALVATITANIPTVNLGFSVGNALITTADAVKYFDVETIKVWIDDPPEGVGGETAVASNSQENNLSAEVLETSASELTDGETETQIAEEASADDLAEKIRQAFASFGLFIENGIAKFEELTARKIIITKAEIEEARIAKAQIRDLEVLGKIQLRDQATDETYCAWLENGEWNKAKSSCSDAGGAEARTETPAVEETETEDPVLEDSVLDEPEPESETADGGQSAGDGNADLTDVQDAGIGAEITVDNDA